MDRLRSTRKLPISMLALWPGVLASRLATATVGSTTTSADSAVSAAASEKPRRGVCLMQLAQEASLVSRHMRAGGSSQQSAVPEWRLRELLSESELADPVLTPLRAKFQVEIPSITSTAAQDDGQCPMVKLSSRVALVARSNSGGEWVTSDNVGLASWRRSSWSQTWKSMQAMTGDGRVALQVDFMTKQQLLDLYDWRVTKNASSFPAIDSLQRRWDAAMFDDPKGRPLPLRYFAVTDCKEQLLFVVQLKAHIGVPTQIDIFDNTGKIVAYALASRKVARYQFVDTQGHLLASAESPGLNQSVSWNVSMQQYEEKVAPYDVLFERGGYANASRLLEVDYRYAIAAALQACAVSDLHAGAAVTEADLKIKLDREDFARLLKQILFWFLCTVVAVIVLSGLRIMYGLTFPDGSKNLWMEGDKLPFNVKRIIM